MRLDLRSLTVFRIVLGALALWSLIERALEFGRFYSSEGVFPTSLLPIVYGSHYPVLPSADGVWIFILGLGILSALLWLLGSAPVITGSLLFAVLCLLHARNPLVEYGADRVLRFALLWSLFLPVASRREPGRYHVAAGFGPQGLAPHVFVAQLSLIYLGTVWARDSAVWWSSLTAGEMALKFDMFSTHFGRALSSFPTLLKMGTALTMGLEIVGPIVLIVWWKNERVRTLIIAFFSLLHLAIALCLGIPFFSLVMIGCLVALLPGMVWTWVGWGDNPYKFPHDPTSVRNYAKALLLLCLFIGSQFFREELTLGSCSEKCVISKVLGVSQSWRVFAPYPDSVDGWFLAVGVARSNQEVDLLSHSSPPRTREMWRAGPRASVRWRKYLLVLRDIKLPVVHHYLVRSLCADQSVRTSGISKVRLTFNEEITDFDGSERPAEERELGSFPCNVGSSPN
jgi:hypothetical protein